MQALPCRWFADVALAHIISKCCNLMELHNLGPLIGV